MKKVLMITIGCVGLLLLMQLALTLHNPLSKDEQLADAIMAKTAKKLEKELHLHPIGTGGQMMYEIKKLYLGFQYFQEVDLEKARELIVYAAQTFLEEINTNEDIRPYLDNYPFTAKNVEIRIWFTQPDGSNVPLEKIDYVSNINGIVTYYLDHPQHYPTIIFHTETYEEACQIVQQHKAAI